MQICWSCNFRETRPCPSGWNKLRKAFCNSPCTVSTGCHNIDGLDFYDERGRESTYYKCDKLGGCNNRE